MESDDDDWLNDFDEPAGEKETTKEMNGGGRGDNGEGERGGLGDERRDGEESRRQQQREHQFYYENHSSEQSQTQSQQQEQQHQQQEYYHNLHNQNSNQNYHDATFDANAPSPIVKTAVKKDIAAAASVSRYAEETPPPKMNGYIDDYDNRGQDTSLTPASYLGTMTPKNDENYSYSNTNSYDTRNDNKVTERPSSASKPSENTVDDWLNKYSIRNSKIINETTTRKRHHHQRWFKIIQTLTDYSREMTTMRHFLIRWVIQKNR
jgi:hypothetical protein